jgi:hypothetical protein
VFHAQGKQLDERSRGKIRLHELLIAREGERCLQLTIDIGEKQWTARHRPVVEVGETGDRLVVLARRESQRDASGGAWCAGCVEASPRAVSEQSQAHRFSKEIAATRARMQTFICSDRYKRVL